MDGMPSLPETPWIQSLRADDRELLSSYGEFVSAQSQAAFIEEGQEQENLYLLVRGSLEVRRHAGEEVIVLATVQPGESIGEVALFDQGPASATVMATEFSQLWRINRSELLTFVTDNPGAGVQLLMGLAQTLAVRLRRSDPFEHAPTHGIGQD